SWKSLKKTLTTETLRSHRGPPRRIFRQTPLDLGLGCDSPVGFVLHSVSTVRQVAVFFVVARWARALPFRHTRKHNDQESGDKQKTIYVFWNYFHPWRGRAFCLLRQAGRS